METIGSPVPYTCPACNGALWESTAGNVREYRCHVGHAYSAEALLIDQDYILEKALWSAIRIFEEQADLLQRLAKRNVNGPLLEKWRTRAAESEKTPPPFARFCKRHDKCFADRSFFQVGPCGPDPKANATQSAQR